MSARDDGGYAFPRNLPKGEFSPDECLRIIREHSGMSLRDAFAMHALGAQIAAKRDEEMRGYDGWRDEIARESYRYADAMLRARKQP